MKRVFDFVFSLVGIIVFSPVLLVLIVLVWLQDWHSPFYIAERVGKNGKTFKMVKLRSMVINADKSGVDSTSVNDKRITAVGHFIRKFKIDEVSQLWNVLTGDMSFVGPRPNVKRETDLYTSEEKQLLLQKPGITDFSSIIFSDEGDILKECEDPDIGYNQLIRPWKSRLGIFYIKNRYFLLDIKLILTTVISVVSREKALQITSKIIHKLNANNELVTIALREQPLVPTPPPGADKIVTNREGRVE